MEEPFCCVCWHSVCIEGVFIGCQMGSFYIDKIVFLS